MRVGRRSGTGEICEKRHRVFVDERSECMKANQTGPVLSGAFHLYGWPGHDSLKHRTQEAAHDPSLGGAWLAEWRVG